MKRLLLASSLLATGFLLGASTARADTEIAFGSFSPAGCVASTNAGDEGRICSPAVLLTAGADIFDIQAFSDHFATAADLTFKPGAGSSETPINVVGETGFGEDALGLTSCGTDAIRCEIVGNASVAISSQVGLIDAIVGSAQSGEDFTVWAGNSLASLVPVGSGAGGSCTSTGTANECLVTFGASKFVGVTSNGTGDVLLAGISVPSAVSIPEPSVMASFGGAILSLTTIQLLRRRRRS